VSQSLEIINLCCDWSILFNFPHFRAMLLSLTSSFLILFIVINVTRTITIPTRDIYITGNVINQHRKSIHLFQLVWKIYNQNIFIKIINEDQVYFFFIRGNSTSRKIHFVSPGKRVKHRRFQILTRDARSYSNSKPAV